ncbi:MAG: BamA/TamA family outer membrane protein [bacterium]
MWRRHYLIYVSLFLIISNSTAFFNFGKNKVRYEYLDWKILNTDRLEIYYYSSEEELANITAGYGEEIARRLEILLKHNLTRKVPIIIYSNHHTFEETQVIPMIIPESIGGITEFLKGRILVPFYGSLPRFKRVLNHEMVHFFTLNKIDKIMRERKKYVYSIPPLWFIEGLAEFLSKEWSSHDDIVMYDALIYGKFAPLTEIHNTYDSYLVYKEGQSLLIFISEEYGEEKIVQLLDDMWTTKDFNELLENVLGDDYETISNKWTNWLRKRYFPKIDKYDPPEIVTNTLISGDAIFSSPVIYKPPDSPSKLIYMTDYMGYESIYIADIEDKDGKISIKNKKKIVKGGPSTMTESLHITGSRISISDNSMFVFVSKSGPQDSINIININTGEVIRRIKFPNIVYISSPFISKNSDKIVFSGSDMSGKNDIYIYNLTTTILTRLTDDWYDDRYPTISKDGKKIVFSSDRGLDGYEGYNIFSISLDKNSSPLQLTFGIFNDIQPLLSDDGSIIFSSDRDGRFNIYELKEGGSLQKLTNIATALFEPIKYDGTTFIATCYQNGSLKIVSIKETEPISIENNQISVISKIGGEKIKTHILPYKSRFTLDFLQAEGIYSPGFQTGIGGSIYFTDMLSDQHIILSFTNTARNWSEFIERMNVGLVYYNFSHRIYYGLGGFHYYYDFYGPFGDYKYTEHIYGGNSVVIFPFNRFYRFEVGTMIYRLNRMDNSEDELKTNIISNFSSFVKDTSLWCPTGPIDGARYNVTFGNNMQLKDHKNRFVVFSFDMRKYFRLSRMGTYAIRGIYIANNGPDAETIYAGGSTGMRGYKFYEFAGEKIFMINQEVRFPIIDAIKLRLPFGEINFGMIRGALFFDIGSAWSEKISKLYGSFGLGLKWSLGGFVVFRLDIAKKTDFISLSDDTPVRFFVGFDY